MKKLLIFFICLFCVNLYGISIELLNFDKTINTRTDYQSNLKLCYFHNNLMLVHSQKTEILIGKIWKPLFNHINDNEYLNTYGKYGVYSASYFDKEKERYYIETKNRLDESFYYCYEFSFHNEELIKKSLNRKDFELIKESLIDVWQDFPVVLENNLELQYYRKAIDFENYNRFFQIVSNTEQILDIKTMFSDYGIIIRPCINDRKNRIAFLACRNEDIDARLDNECCVFILSIIYDAKCNDSKVRIRKEPNLNCETITYLNKDDNVKIYDRSDEMFEINNEEWYWYQVKTDNDITGWVYGKYLDIEK